MPSNELITLFETPHTVQDTLENLVLKQTQIKINDNFTLRRAFWTAYQRQAAANTRDHFLYGFEPKKPMLSDLSWTQPNNEMVREFILALLRAEVDVAIIKDVCYAQLQKQQEGSQKQQEGSQKKTLNNEQPMSKTKVTVTAQRTSITDFAPIAEDIQAATRLQRLYRKRLAKKKAAMRVIEAWWEPFRLETEEVRLEMMEHRRAFIQEIDEEQGRQRDLFAYNELLQEIKDDYKTTRQPELRPPSYWVKVVVILALPIYLATLVEIVPYGAMVVLYVAGHIMTNYRKVWFITWLQTLGMWTWTVIMLNSAFILNNGWIRIPVWLAIVALGKQHWIAVFVACLLVRIGLTFVYDAFSIQPIEYGIFLYDFYCMATIAAASRQGTPMQMLQKVMINIIFLVIISASAAMMLFGACFNCTDCVHL